MVFSHGWMLRSGAWHYQRLGLAGPGFGEPPGPVARMVFFDQRSHGRSTRAALGHSTMVDLASDLASVIRTAAPDGPLVVVAHSMGGMALLALAGREPEFIAERLAGAALVSTASTQIAQPEISRLVSGSTPGAADAVQRRRALSDDVRAWPRRQQGRGLVAHQGARASPARTCRRRWSTTSTR